MTGGVLAEISNLRVLGARPDGTADPGADMVAVVDFDPVAAGCDITNGFCTPGAEVQFYLNGKLMDDLTPTGYDNSLGGYSVSSSNFTAPDSGTLQITARSLNQLDADVVVAATGAEPGEGQVNVTAVTCGNSPYFECSCEANSQLIIYYARTIAAVGQGTAYVDVFMDGTQIVANQPTSTSGGEGMDSVAVSCPDLKSSHTILVKGKNDTGASAVLNAGTPLGGNYSYAATAIGGGTIPDSGDQSATVSQTIGASPAAGMNTLTIPSQPATKSTAAAGASPCQGLSRGGALDLTCALESSNQVWLAAGVVAIGIVGIAIWLNSQSENNFENDDFMRVTSG